MKPIEDRVEISIDFPDKFYRGAFEGESRYDAQAEGDGLHHNVLAGLLTAWAESLKDADPVDRRNAADLKSALHAVEKALG